ncbi:uncharacterized protein DUF2680 [Melghiribacillus thermohalophilus]|uniref:Uncharacterized protein DUF2680 n=1 Tax=Melghiribacillus thermohalophilus TaxID=1324956 RepID=A0A4R3MV41_9BACI|nr:YckD family protein [Melghiribacillus thermohalophilus]TCT19366.1 uncharacterized protein DUF2680 [Melghiribacillus thermohalophilus]
MKRLTILCITFMTVWLLAAVTPASAENEEEDVKTEDVTLTDEQKKELDAMYQEYFAVHKDIINKYVEFGIMDQEKAEKKISFLDKHYEKLKENGFVMKWDDKKHKKFRDQDKKTSDE